MVAPLTKRASDTKRSRELLLPMAGVIFSGNLYGHQRKPNSISYSTSAAGNVFVVKT